MRGVTSGQKSARQGFTLVELSIALVIIALIIGGVMVGRDMLSTAQVKAGIHQLEGYQSAINNFRLRYQGIPGDLYNATSQFSNTAWPDLEDGDGDGILRDASGAESDPDDAHLERDTFTGELPQFWYQLSAAHMVDAQFDGGHAIGVSFPYSKVGSGGIAAYGVTDDTNYFYVGMVAPTDAVTKAVLTQDVLTPEQAWEMDRKMDDGHPMQGTVRAAGGGNFDDGMVYYTMVSADPVPLPVKLALQAVRGWLLPAAYADTSTAAEREACVFKNAGEDDSTAYYATGAGGINCQLRVRWK